MNWKVSLDRYLTSAPDDRFDSWVESVFDEMSDSFYNENEKMLNEYDGKCNKWLNILFNRGYAPKQAATFIERLFKKL